MSDRAKPWLETWEQDDDAGMRVMVADTDEQVARVFDGGERAAFSRRMSLADQELGLARSLLAAAAPALARALCRVEWGSYRDITDYESQEEVCPACDCPPVTITNRYGVVTPGGHAPDCPLDAALTAAGLATEDREEVRRG